MQLALLTKDRTCVNCDHRGVFSDHRGLFSMHSMVIDVNIGQDSGFWLILAISGLCLGCAQ